MTQAPSTVSAQTTIEKAPQYRKKAHLYLFTVMGLLMLILAWDVIAKLRHPPQTEIKNSTLPHRNDSVADFEKQFNQTSRTAPDPLLATNETDSRAVLPPFLPGNKNAIKPIADLPPSEINSTALMEDSQEEAEKKRVYLSRRTPLTLSTRDISFNQPSRALPSTPIPSKDPRTTIEEERQRIQALRADLPSPYTPTPSLPSPSAHKADKPPSRLARPISLSDDASGDQNQPTVILPPTAIIYAVLDQVVMSDYEGSWRGLITQDVYDVSNNYIVIPSGSRVLGKVLHISNINEPIQQRVGFTVNTMVLPDGQTVSFEKTAVLDKEGIAAVKDNVDYHFMAQFLGVMAYAVLTNNVTQPSESQTASSGDGLIGSGSNHFAPLADKYLALVPTITIRQGQPLRIMLEESLHLKPWRDLSVPPSDV